MKANQTAGVSDYPVRGIIVNLGDALTPRKRAAALRAIREAVPEFANATSAAAVTKAQPLGEGAADVFVPLARGQLIDARQGWNIVHALMANGQVLDAEPAVRVPSATAPDDHVQVGAVGVADSLLDAAKDPKWSVRNAGLIAAWKQSRGDGVRIGHPDTGYTRHPQLLSVRLRVQDGHDFEDDRADPLDPLKGSAPGHGTSTASVIMGDGNPVFGAAPEAELVPFRVSDSVIHFDFSHLTEALYRARDKQCHLVSMSLGGPWAGRSLSRAVDALIADDIILLAAAGNVWPYVVYPAKFDNVVAVAASNAEDKPWKKSAKGDEVDISAPGESVWRVLTGLSNGAPAFKAPAPSSGTSYAVATLAGACALWLSLHGVKALRKRYPGRVAAVFLQLLKSSGFRPVAGWSTSKHGVGILDAEALLKAALPMHAPAIAVAPRAAIARSERSYAWARLQPYFPELEPDELARAVLPSFGARSAIATRQLADVIDEVEFWVAVDPQLRRSVIESVRPPTGKRAAITIAPKPALHAIGSARLRAALK